MVKNGPFRRLALCERFLVDGGYVSWVYGSSYGRQRSWSSSARFKFVRSKGAIILLDHPINARRQFSVTYKSRRDDRRVNDPVWIQKTAQVEAFRNDYLLEDPSLDKIMVEGLEADDLIAIMVSLHLLPEPVRMIGVDKDLLQLGDWSNFQMKRVTGERMSISKYASRLPVHVQSWIREPEHILLTLALLGDKSDSIPRLVPPRRFDEFIEIIRHVNPWKKAYSIYGHHFVDNLYLTILPGPFTYKVNPSPMEVYRRLLKGESPRQLYPVFRTDVVEAIFGGMGETVR